MTSFASRRLLLLLAPVVMSLPNVYGAESIPEVVAVLRVIPRQESGISRGKNESPRAYEVRRRTLSALLDLRAGRDDALQHPELENLALLKTKSDPLLWFAESIRVVTPTSTELIIVSLPIGAEDPDEAAKLLDAFVNSFVSEFEGERHRHKVAALQQLRRRYRVNYEEVKRKTDEVSNLARQLGTLDDKRILQQQQINLLELSSAKQEHDRLKREYNKALSQLQLMESKVRVETTSPSEQAIEDELEKDAQFHQLSQEIRAVKEHLNSLSAQVRKGSNAVRTLQEGLGTMERQRANVREELVPRIVARLASKDGVSTSAAQQQEVMFQKQIAQNLEEQVLAAEAGYQQKLAEVREYGGSSGELEARMQELGSLRLFSQQLREKMQQLEIQIEGEASFEVRVIQPARRTIRVVTPSH